MMPTYRCEQQTLMVGDCMRRLEEIDTASIDVVVTSPPYNLGIAYNAYDDAKPRSQYLQWMDAVAGALHRVLRPDGSLFLNIGGSNADPWVSFDVGNVFRTRFVLQNHIMWMKSVSIGEDTVGHFKPINSPRYLNHNHEAIFHFTKTGEVPIDRLAVGVPFKHKSNIGRRGHAQDKRCAGNIWYIPYKTVRSKMQKYGHPSGYPVELARRCIKLHGHDGQTVVLDPFVGAGTTLVAAAELGCQGIGIESDATYVERALARVQNCYAEIAKTNGTE